MRPLSLLACWTLLSTLFLAGCGYKQPVSEVQTHLKGYVQKVSEGVDAKASVTCKAACDEVLAKTNLVSHDRASFELLSRQCQSADWEGAKETVRQMKGGK